MDDTTVKSRDSIATSSDNSMKKKQKQKKKRLKKSKGILITGSKIQGQGGGRGGQDGTRGRSKVGERGGAVYDGNHTPLSSGSREERNIFKDNNTKDGTFWEQVIGSKLPEKQSMSYKLNMSRVVRKEVAERVHQRNQRSLYVRFPSTITVAKVEDIYSSLGKVAADGRVNLPRPTRTKLYNYCYIEFESEAIMRMKKEEINQVEVEGKKFYADFLHDKINLGELNSLRLYVDNLPASITKEDLKKIFMTSCSISFNNGNNFAYINYATKDEALNVFKRYKILNIRGTNVRVNFAKLKTAEKRNAESKMEEGVENDKPDDASDIAPPAAKKIKVKGKVYEETKVFADEGDNDEMKVKEESCIKDDQEEMEEEGGGGDDEEQHHGDDDGKEEQDGDDELHM